jgi:hypothetical protein
MKNKTTALVKTKTKPLQLPPNSDQLTDKEKEHLEELETQIADNFKSAFTLAAALAEIRDNKLYREDYKTFGAYCKKRWDYSRSYCERLADMNGVLVDLKKYEDNEVFPRNELQARVFVPLNKEQRIELLKTAQEKSKAGNTTAAELMQYKIELFPALKEKKAESATTRDPVIDVKATVIPMPAIPSVIKIVASASEVLEGLVDDGCDDNELAENLREFIKLAEPLVKWQKANLN